MERVKRRKPSKDEMEKAINPALTDAEVFLCGRRFKILVMPLNKEQVFLKLLRRVLPEVATGAGMVDALLNADLGVLCEMAAIIANNSGEDLTTGDILEGGRLVDVVALIETQLEETGTSIFCYEWRQRCREC